MRGLDAEEVGSGLKEGGQELGGDLGDGDGFGGGDRLLRGGRGDTRGSCRSGSRGRLLGRRQEDVDGVCGSLGVGDQGSGKDGSVVNLVVAASQLLLQPKTNSSSRVAEQIPEAHDGVLAVLDQVRLGTVTDVLISVDR